MYDIKASVRQTPPSYSIAFYNDKTTFKNTNKLFAEFPTETFEAIRQAQVVRVRFTYDNGDTVELPLNEHDLEYWKNQLFLHVRKSKFILQRKKLQDRNPAAFFRLYCYANISKHRRSPERS